jgi:hypothetical protein
LLEHPELINHSPYESGWIVKIKPSNLQEFEQLMTKEQYSEFVGETNQDKKDNQDKQEKKSNEGPEEQENRNSQANGQSI